MEGAKLRRRTCRGARQGQGCLRYVKRGREKADRGEEQSRAYTV